MFLTNNFNLSGRSLDGMPEDLSYVVRYEWASAHQLREAVRVLLTARLHAMEMTESTVSEESMTKHRLTLSADLSIDVQKRLASNPHTSTFVLDFLAHYAVPEVVARVAENPRCAKETVDILVRHESPAVRSALAESHSEDLNLMEVLAQDEHPDVRFSVADNPGANPKILALLSADENPFVSMKATENLGRRKLGEVVTADFSGRFSATLKVVAD